jgi:hypothetical protein
MLMHRIALLLVAALGACRAEGEAPTQAAKPELALLTSLPIAFGERFGLDQQRSPSLETLETSFRVIPIDGPEQLRGGGLMLAAQPQALTAERLVALDKWVRDGGRLVLLADPMLRFEGSRSLGDRFRPPLRYPDTGLLKHWGLLLDEATDSRLEEVETDLGRRIKLTTGGLGSFTRAGGNCTLSPTRTVARCRIGKGYATLVADADFALSRRQEDRDVVVALLRELAR